MHACPCQHAPLASPTMPTYTSCCSCCVCIHQPRRRQHHWSSKNWRPQHGLLDLQWGSAARDPAKPGRGRPDGCRPCSHAQVTPCSTRLPIACQAPSLFQQLVDCWTCSVDDLFILLACVGTPCCLIPLRPLFILMCNQSWLSAPCQMWIGRSFTRLHCKILVPAEEASICWTASALYLVRHLSGHAG